MKKIKVKYIGFDEKSLSVLVAFSSDDCKHDNPEAYPTYSFQPLTMWPDVDDIEEIKRRIAFSGLHLVEQQARKESFVADETKVNLLKNLVGETTEFDTEELFTYNNEVTV